MTLGKSFCHVWWTRSQTQRNHYNFFEKHILPFQFRCLWWWFVINCYIHGNKSQFKTFGMKMNQSWQFLFSTNFNRYAYLSIELCNPWHITLCLTEKRFAQPELFLPVLECHKLLSKYRILMETHSFEHQTILF